MNYKYKRPIISEVEAPYLPIKIYNETKKIMYPQKESVEALIDTGYDGYLIVPSKIFNDLKLNSSRIPQDEVLKAETITGDNIELITALGHCELPDMKLIFSIEIDTTTYCSEILIGRRLLESLIIKLNGPNKELNIEK
jgi:clan AA aspartic protease